MNEFKELQKAIDDFKKVFFREAIQPWAEPIVEWLAKGMRKWQ